MTNEELQQLAAQLRHPEGDYGIVVSEMMNETNMTMTKDAIGRLQLCNGDRILELGHGNAGHIPYIIEQAAGLTYSGLELSQLMHTEAQRINKHLLAVADFSLYDGTIFPFPDRSFDKAFSVNTIYFWTDPLHTLREFYRVLKPGALLCITYGEESFMKQMPFTSFGFTLYNRDTVTALFSHTEFYLSDIQSRTELVKSKTGGQVEREFSTIRLKKQN